MTPFLSIIIAHRNEPEHLLETVRTIRETSPVDAVEIIVVDDASLARLDPGAINSALRETRVFEPGERQHKIRIFSSPTRQGHAAQRQFGAQQAAGEWLMFTDAHMAFQPGWFENFARHTSRVDRKSLLGGPYLSYKPDDEYVGTFYGAQFKYYGESLFEPGKLELLMIVPYADRPAPLDGAENEPFEAPAVIGANYFLTRDWFFHIGGLPCFVHWSGTDEWMLSVKTWLCGGTVKIMPDVHVRHVLYPTGHGATGYGKEMDKGQLLFNKLSAAYQVLPSEIYEPFVSCLPIAHWSEEMQGALNMMIERQEQLDYWRRYCQSVFVQDHDWLCAKFNIDHPADIGAVVG